jgi:hypothetical protein
MCALCVVCWKGLEEAREGESFIRNLENEVREGENMYVLCV